MSNPHGTPIWYELMTPDPDAAKRFYDDVVGWTIGEPHGEAGYRMVSAADGPVGGVLGLTEEMTAGGARPAWLVYLSVDSVDDTAAQAAALGGHVLVPPHDLPGVGRFSLLTDPHGAPFYIMRDTSGRTSSAFAPRQLGHGAWNELSSPDFPASLAFYGKLFGWDNRDTMDTGPMGGYHFLNAGDLQFGAAAEVRDRPAHWNIYFCVPDVDTAIERVRAGGGTIDMGPHDVPSGDRIVLGTDPQQARFALVSHT